MGSIQDPKYGGIHTRAARTRAKCAFLTSYDKNPLRLDLSKRFQTEKNRDLDSFRRIVGIVCIEQRWCLLAIPYDRKVAGSGYKSWPKLRFIQLHLVLHCKYRQGEMKYSICTNSTSRMGSLTFWGSTPTHKILCMMWWCNIILLCILRMRVT